MTNVLTLPSTDEMVLVRASARKAVSPDVLTPGALAGSRLATTRLMARLTRRTATNAISRISNAFNGLWTIQSMASDRASLSGASKSRSHTQLGSLPQGWATAGHVTDAGPGRRSDYDLASN